MNKKTKKEFGEAARTSLMKEMAQPRMSKSARKEEEARKCQTQNGSKHLKTAEE